MCRETSAAQADDTGILNDLANLLFGQLRCISVCTKSLDRLFFTVILHQD